MHCTTPTRTRRLAVSFLIRIALSMVIAAILVPVASLADERPLPHRLTKAAFRQAKSLSAVGAPTKDGALGDAAAGSDRYDMLRHALDLKIDPGNEWIGGSVTYDFASVVEGLSVMVLDLTAELDVTAVESPGGDLAFVHDADSLLITLGEPLALGAEAQLTVHYEGYPVEPSWDRGLLFRVHNAPAPDESSVPIVANLSEPAYAQAWWPCKDKPGDKALSEMRLTVPDTLVGVSNGTLISEGPSGEPGWDTYVWSEAYPIASYLVSVAISDYQLLSDPCVTTLGQDLGYDIPLRNWVFPISFEDALVDFAPLCEMLEVCEGNYGPYPFRGEKYGHAEFIWFGAMEHQTVTSIGASTLHGDRSSDWLIVHELGHQWFGDHLTPALWKDIWLNEGFATYTEALWEEYENGRDAYLAALEYGRDESSWELQGPVYDPVPVFPGHVIYDKGAWILHMLRGRLGDGPFFALLNEWGRTGGRTSAQVGQEPHVGYVVTTEEFIALAGIHAGEDLNDFFWPYLTETELPEIVFQREIQDGDAGPDTRLSVLLRQTQGPLFDNVFPVKVTTESGTETRLLRLSEETAEAVWEFDAPVSFATLDPEHWVLWKPAYGTSSTAGLTRVFPNPSNGNLLNLRYHLEAPSRVVLRVFDAAGREIHRWDLGVVEPEAGFNEMAWNQRDTQGARPASGVYWATLEIDGDRSVRKFTIVR